MTNPNIIVTNFDASTLKKNIKTPDRGGDEKQAKAVAKAKTRYVRKRNQL